MIGYRIQERFSRGLLAKDLKSSQLHTAYDQSKFGFTWLGMAHDDSGILSMEDDHLEGFFKEHESVLRDSFVVFMGDHGPRFGNSVNTELGKMERNNPLLIITVPEQLRGNKKLMETMAENSRKLLTTFDIHATLVDILKFAPKSNFTDFNHTTIFETNPNNATSLLRPLGPFSKRTCRNIPISFQYCLCEHDRREVRSLVLARKLHEFLINEINLYLQYHNVSENCAKLEPNQIISLFNVGFMKNNLFEVVFTSKPGDGEFKAFVHYDDKTNYIARKGDLERINFYGEAGNCVRTFLREYCFCLPSKAGSLLGNL